MRVCPTKAARWPLCMQSVRLCHTLQKHDTHTSDTNRKLFIIKPWSENPCTRVLKPGGWQSVSIITPLPDKDRRHFKRTKQETSLWPVCVSYVYQSLKPKFSGESWCSHQLVRFNGAPVRLSRKFGTFGEIGMCNQSKNPNSGLKSEICKWRCQSDRKSLQNLEAD